MKKVLKILLILLIIVVVAFVGLLGMLTITEYRPADIESLEVRTLGDPDGTPRLALPLKGGQDRRYPVGKIVVTE